ncbi:MAG: HAMP domain-containing protein [Alcanivorax sp.]|nr:HAMP domain-containing protein [Alcanivorax sp.]
MTSRWRDTAGFAGRHVFGGLRSLLPDYLPVAWKLGLTFSALVLIGMSVLGSIILSTQLTTMQNQADRLGRTIATQLADSAREPLLADDPLALKVLVSNLADSENLEGAALFDRDLRLKYRAGRLPTDAVPTISGPVRQWRDANAPMTTYFAAIRAADATAGHAAVTLSGAPIVAAQAQARRTMITATLLMSLIAVVAAFLISRRLARPLSDLVAATTALRAGDLNVRLAAGHSNDEIGQLLDAYNNMAHGLLEKTQVERALSRFVSPRVAEQMMADLGEVQLGGREVHATVLFADIVGFTSLSEGMAPDAVAALLNDYFNAISTAADFYRGNIDKFMGDCAMLVFGVPEEDNEHLYHGLCCAVMIQRLVQRLNAQRQARGQVIVDFRVGLNSGPMLAGNLGSKDRMQYTVVGDSVNLASRLSTMAAAGEIIMPDHLVNDPNVAPRVRTHVAGTMRIRGKSEPVLTHRVEGVHPQSEALMEQRIARFLSEYTDVHIPRVSHVS